MKLNIGCGYDIKKGYMNLDKEEFSNVDIKHNLNKFPYPFKDNTFEEILSLGVLELLDDFIKVMEELHRICKPNAIIKIRCAAFPSMCSAQDPLVKKFMTWNTFDYFNGYWNYSKAILNIKKREYIFSINRFHWINPIINLFPVFYSRFLFNIFPATTLYFELEVIKKCNKINKGGQNDLRT